MLVRTLNQFQKIVADNPFQHVDLSKLHGTMLASKPAKKWLAAIDEISFGDDQFQVVGNTVYVFCPHGYGRTKLHNGFFESKLKTQATTRNWKTIHKLIELASEG